MDGILLALLEAIGCAFLLSWLMNYACSIIALMFLGDGGGFSPLKQFVPELRALTVYTVVTFVAIHFCSQFSHTKLALMGFYI